MILLTSIVPVSLFTLLKKNMATRKFKMMCVVYIMSLLASTSCFIPRFWDYYSQTDYGTCSRSSNLVKKKSGFEHRSVLLLWSHAWPSAHHGTKDQLVE